MSFHTELGMLTNTVDEGACDSITTRVHHIIDHAEPAELQAWFQQAANERLFAADEAQWIALSLIIDRLLDRHLEATR